MHLTFVTYVVIYIVLMPYLLTITTEELHLKNLQVDVSQGSQGIRQCTMKLIKSKMKINLITTFLYWLKSLDT